MTIFIGMSALLSVIDPGSYLGQFTSENKVGAQIGGAQTGTCKKISKLRNNS